MRFVFQFPETGGLVDDMLQTGSPAEVALHAEQAGFDAISFTEHPAPSARWLESGGHQSLDPFVALAAAGAVTSTIRLMTNLTVAPYRNPMLLAKSAATLDRLSGGRVILGMGVGYLKSEYVSLGVDFEERNVLFDEALAVLPLHWSGEPFSFEGTHFSAREVVALPKPTQQPIPIWIGGNSNLSRRRVVNSAHGWMPMLGPASLSTAVRTKNIETLEELAPIVAETRAKAAEVGRPDAIDICCTYDLNVQTGTNAEQHREQIAAYEKAGVTWMVVSCASTSQEQSFAFLDWFGADVLS
ncbi:MAG TPA: LLM class F420-dependent oxidoreductase [Jatrophihabitans sp.]|jgi:probable F420-dependent oxidoreductase